MWTCMTGVVCVFMTRRRRHTGAGSDWSSDVCSSDRMGERGDRSSTVTLGLLRAAVRAGEAVGVSTVTAGRASEPGVGTGMTREAGADTQRS